MHWLELCPDQVTTGSRLRLTYESIVNNLYNKKITKNLPLYVADATYNVK